MTLIWAWVHTLTTWRLLSWCQTFKCDFLKTRKELLIIYIFSLWYKQIIHPRMSAIIWDGNILIGGRLLSSTRITGILEIRTAEWCERVSKGMDSTDLLREGLDALQARGDCTGRHLLRRRSGFDQAWPDRLQSVEMICGCMICINLDYASVLLDSLFSWSAPGLSAALFLLANNGVQVRINQLNSGICYESGDELIMTVDHSFRRVCLRYWCVKCSVPIWSGTDSAYRSN